MIPDDLSISGGPGADVIERVFSEQDSGQAEVYVSYTTIFELLYLAMARRGHDDAASFIVKVRGLNMKEIWPDEDLLWEAARIKSLGGLSVADSFVAATALRKEAVLVHKDAEFGRLSMSLPVQLLDLSR